MPKPLKYDYDIDKIKEVYNDKEKGKRKFRLTARILGYSENGMIEWIHRWHDPYTDFPKKGMDKELTKENFACELYYRASTDDEGPYWLSLHERAKGLRKHNFEQAFQRWKDYETKAYNQIIG